MARLRPDRGSDPATGRTQQEQARARSAHGGRAATIIERRWQGRRLDCPYVFHREGTRIGDFRKVWDRACAAIGFEGRIVHDLRRSGVRHLIRAGVPPHTVMAMSGHRTASMLKRYDISLDDLRQATRRGSEYAGQPTQVSPLKRAEPVENP